MSLIQNTWNPVLATCSHNMLSNDVLHSKKIDCTIHSLVVLGFLTMPNGMRLSEQLHQYQPNNPTGSSLVNITTYLGNYLNKYVSNKIMNTTKDLTTFLVQNLNIGNVTMMSFMRNNNTGHTILVYRQTQDIFIYIDVQQGTHFYIDKFNEHEPNIRNIILYIVEESSPGGQVIMDIENSDDYLTARAGGGKRKKNKKTKNKKTKNKKTKNKKTCNF